MLFVIDLFYSVNDCLRDLSQSQSRETTLFLLPVLTLLELRKVTSLIICFHFSPIKEDKKGQNQARIPI